MTENKLIFDFGTNSFKAFLYDADNKMLFQKKVENRLGDGGSNSKISGDSTQNAINILNVILDDVKKFGPYSTKAFGTEIFRIAENAGDVIDEIKNKTGVVIQVLSQQDELEYYWKGLVKDFNHDGDIAAIDIGGGSVQFMYGDKNKLKGSYLLKTGALFLRKMFIENDPATVEAYKKIEEYIAEQIKDINVKFAPNTPFIHGATSVIDFYTEAKLNLVPFESSKSHPYKIDLKDSRDFYNTMKILPKNERAKYFPSQPDFTDGASIGLANVLLLAEKTGLTYEVPSNHNLINGFL
ncbi:MAG: hypothetical protein LBL47_02235 [Lactobacillus sp.]|jgi:exopolyphosphatase/guanosine-5'-triphosphate,3'-diphosphate pyrophosphatase|nr:hypothetical protein [Lactobacillus sp.]